MMFDDGLLKPYFDSLKQQMRRDILNLIDFALDTRDVEWWKELLEELKWVETDEIC